MALVIGRNFSVELCKALGIETRQVRSVTLKCEPEDAVTVTIERFVNQEEADKVVRLIEEHRAAGEP